MNRGVLTVSRPGDDYLARGDDYLAAGDEYSPAGDIQVLTDLKRYPAPAI